MYNVAILYICTGKYSVLWEEFYLSFKKHFLKDSKVEYFVFTDAEKVFCEDNDDVHKIYQKNLGWPDNTLRRFDIFLKIKETILKYDFVYFVNANMRCVKDVKEEEFLPLGTNENLAMVKHAGCYDKEVDKFPYEQNRDSLAYVSFEEGQYYVMGSLNGGKTANYMKMAEELSVNVENDWKKGIVAIWHDESHLNRYLLGREDVKLLPPAFCAAEGLEYPFEPKMVLVDKSKYFDVEAVKAGNFFGRIKLYLGRIKSKLALRSRMRKLINFFKKGV